MFPSLMRGVCGVPDKARHYALTLFALLALLLVASGDALAHIVAEGDKGYIQEIYGIHLMSFIYLGTKHMVTGYDHILFLLGVIFFLYWMQHIAIYVSLFALGHSTTMLLGVYFNIGINSYLINAIIGLSVVYKALVRLPAQHQGGDAGLRLLPRLRPLDQDHQVRDLDERLGHQPAGVQRRRGDRPAAGHGGHPHRDGILAAHRRLPATCLHRQWRHDWCKPAPVSGFVQKGRMPI